MRTDVASWALLCATMLFAGAISAQQYPTKPVRLIVPTAPGGTTDLLGRLLAQEISKNAGKQFIVENKAGASGIIGTETVAKAAPDGYTLLVTTATHTINPSLYKTLPYDSLADFSAVTLMASAPMVLIVHPSVPANSLKEFIALARKPDSVLNYSSAGNGTPSHLVVELFKDMTATEITHIPYKGGGPSNADIMSGQVQVKFASVVTTVPMIRAGKVKALGVTSSKRVGILPDVPTIAEAGVASFEFGLWYVLLGPANLNKSVVDFLNVEARKALMSNSIKSQMEPDGGEILGTSPQAATDHLRKETARFAALIKKAGVPAQ